MGYRLRTLLIVLALGPPVLAWGWSNYPRPIHAPESEKALKQLQADLAALEKAVGPPRPIYCGPYEE